MKPKIEVFPGNEKKLWDLFATCLGIVLRSISDEGYIRTENSSEIQNMRYTLQFISALSKLSFGKNDPLVKNAYDWLLSKHYQKVSLQSPIPELIEAAIELNDIDNHIIQDQIRFLINGRKGPLDYNLQNSRHSDFSTLWAVKLLLGISKENKYMDKITESINSLIPNLQMFDPRMKAFLVSLVFNIKNKMISYEIPNVDNYFESLLELNITGLVVDQKYDFLNHSLQQCKDENISLDLIIEQEDSFYDVIIDNLYIVENLLMVKSDKYNIENLLLTIAAKIISIIPSSEEKISELFKEPYRVLMFALRFLNCFLLLHKNDIERIIIMLVTELAKKEEEAKYYEHSKLQQVVKEWIEFDWNSKVDQELLKGGLSGNKVIRVKPKIIVPGNEPVAIENMRTIIIKIGNKTDFDKERRNYNSIPEDYKYLFGFISQQSFPYPGNNDLECLITEDISNAVSLTQLIPKLDIQQINQISLNLVSKLEHLYEMEPIIRDAKKEFASLIREHYIASINKSLERIHKFKQLMDVYYEVDKVSNLHIFTIINNLEYFEFTPTIMHGDLNCGNIMITDKYNHEPLIIKLIDLDHFTRTGDYAFDIGELLVDISIKSEKPEIKVRKTSQPFCNEIETRFMTYAAKKQDTNFGKRLILAKIRSYLKFCEIKAKYGITSYFGGTSQELNAKKNLDEMQVYLPIAYELLNQLNVQINS